MKKPKYKALDPLWKQYQQFLKWRASLVVSWVLQRELIKTSEDSSGVWRWIEYSIYNAEFDLFEIRGISLMGSDRVFSIADSRWFATKKEYKKMQHKLNLAEL